MMMTAYPVAAEAMDLETYVLAALFAGSNGLRQIEADQRGLRWVRSTFEASEVSRRLIGLAVLLRSHLDSGSVKSTARVGHFLPDIANPAIQKDLLLREACNKIIHAEDIDLHGHEQDSESTPSLSRCIRLRGQWDGKDWQAEIDVLAFLNETCKHS